MGEFLFENEERLARLATQGLKPISKTLTFPKYVRYLEFDGEVKTMGGREVRNGSRIGWGIPGDVQLWYMTRKVGFKLDPAILLSSEMYNAQHIFYLLLRKDRYRYMEVISSQLKGNAILSLRPFTINARRLVEQILAEKGLEQLRQKT